MSKKNSILSQMKNGTLSQIKPVFGALVIQLVWYILKQLFISMSVKAMDIIIIVIVIVIVIATVIVIINMCPKLQQCHAGGSGVSGNKQPRQSKTCLRIRLSPAAQSSALCGPEAQHGYPPVSLYRSPKLL